MGYWWGWKPYVSVAEKKQKAEKLIAKLKKKGGSIAPVIITGRKIASSFWGISWCKNLERYSDYESRLPRGRSYVRSGSVIDLQIGKGEVTAKVSGTELYAVKINIEPVTPERWKAICKDCAGAIDSLVELLQGRLAKGVMDRVCRETDGLFPAPGEIGLSCSCPDWADMCKHVAAALYGIGARLDEQPELLFLLRGVNESDLIASAGETLAQPESLPGASNVLVDADMAALFGLDMADSAEPEMPVPAGKSPRPKKAAKSVAAKDAGKTASKPASKGKAAKPGKAAAPKKTPEPQTTGKSRGAAARAEAKPKTQPKSPVKTTTGKK